MIARLIFVPTPSIHLASFLSREKKNTETPKTTKHRFSTLTHVGFVVDEDDLLEEVVGRAVEDGVHRPQQHGPGLVVETDDHRGRGQLRAEPVRSLAPTEQTSEFKKAINYEL